MLSAAVLSLQKERSKRGYGISARTVKVLDQLSEQFDYRSGMTCLRVSVQVTVC